MPDVNELKKKFDPNHVVINVKKDVNEEKNIRNTKRISLNTLDWLSGKVEILRRKFSAASHEQDEIEAFKKLSITKLKGGNENGRRMSESDGDLLEICHKYQIASANKYTWIAEPFESIVVEYGDLIRTNKIEIHREKIDSEGNVHEPPRGILLLPLSSAAGQALLNFSEMGGFSLGRGSLVAKQASRALSRTHCMLYLENNRVYIKDCDSITGTFVNGKLLGSSIPVLLENFDIIQLGYGGNREDYIQSMAVFLDKWNSKEFSSSIQQLNNSPMSFSRTLSSASLNAFYTDSEYEQLEMNTKKSVPNSPLVSSPKMTKITSQSVKAAPMQNEVITVVKPGLIEPEEQKGQENQVYRNDCKRKPADVPKHIEIVKPQDNLLKSPKMQEYAESPKIQAYEFETKPFSTPKTNETGTIEASTVFANAKPQMPVTNIEIGSQPNSARNEGYKVQYHRKETSGVSTTIIPSTPVHKPSISNYSQSARVATNQTAPLADNFQSLSSPRPPIPRPRQMKKGLSKSAENLIEVELNEIVKEVEKKTTTNTSESRNVKMPLEAALSARRPTLQQPILNVEIPEFLKAENLRIPAMSPAQELLTSSKMMFSSNQNMKRKFDLPTGKKRSDRIEKMTRESSQFTTIIQGANTKRFETFVDFGSGTSDISDGLAQSQVNKKDSIRSVFNNFRVTWNMETLNQSTGNKLVLEALSMNLYELKVEGRNVDSSRIKIGAVQMNLKNNLQAKTVFKIDDLTFQGITGSGIELEKSLPLKALEQLSYFYPHLEMPSILIQGPPESPNDKVTINLVTSKKSTQIGRINFESQNVTWTKRQMVYAVDLDTSHVEIDSLLSDTIHSLALLYCLRYHID